MSAVDLFGLLVPVTYLAMLGIEALFPAREFPAIPYWRLKGFAFLTVQGLLATLTPLLIPEHWLQAHRLINLESLGVIGGAALDETAGYAKGPSAAEPISNETIAANFKNLAAAARYFQPEHFQATFETGLEMLLAGIERAHRERG